MEENGHIVRPSIPAYSNGNAHLYYILMRSHEDRTKVINFLRAQGVFAVFHYVPLHSAPAGIRFGRTVGSLAVTDDISARLLRLPLWPDMTSGDVERVVTAIAEALRIAVET
jgi:dTDP-4-amino-4,6-dideoxygalactose transaminase